jgi:hypothetical protein
VIAAVIGSPYFILTPGKVIQDVYEALYLAGQHGFHGWQIDPAGGYIFYLKSLTWGLGLGLLCLTLAGLAVAVLRHSAEDVVVLSLPVTMYILMGRQRMYFGRFILPMVPALLILGSSLWEKIPTILLRGQRNVALGLAAGALVFTAQPLVSSLRSDYLLTQADTRTLAKQWIEQNIPEGAKVALDWRTHAPPLSTTEQPRPASHREYDVLQVGETGLSEHSIAWYEERDFDYLIASSFIYRIPLRDKTKNAARQQFYNSLDQKLDLVKQFRPCKDNQKSSFIFDELYGPAISLWERKRPGPTIKIYRLEENGE